QRVRRGDVLGGAHRAGAGADAAAAAVHPRGHARRGGEGMSGRGLRVARTPWGTPSFATAGQAGDEPPRYGRAIVLGILVALLLGACSGSAEDALPPPS